MDGLKFWLPTDITNKYYKEKGDFKDERYINGSTHKRVMDSLQIQRERTYSYIIAIL